MDAVERVIATLEAQVVGAEATLGAVGNAEERANAALVAKNAEHVIGGAPAHDATSQRCVERVTRPCPRGREHGLESNGERRRSCVSPSRARVMVGDRNHTGRPGNLDLKQIYATT